MISGSGRFTPMAEKLFNLIPGDLGRPIGDIKPNINVPNLDGLITETIDSVSARELDVQDVGRTLVPYAPTALQKPRSQDRRRSASRCST
jgi:hypothetical protein